MIDTCKANLIQHPFSRGREQQGTCEKLEGEGTWRPCGWVSPADPSVVRTALSPQQELENGVYFRMECKARRPQRASTPLKSMVHLARSPSGQINKTHYSSTQRGKYKHVPNIKSLACGMTAVYETVDVQTWKYASECFLDWLSAAAVLHILYSQNSRSRGQQTERRNQQIRQYMKIYGSIHINSCYKLTANMNNLHFLQGWNYHMWTDLLEPLRLKMTTISILWPKDVENTTIVILVKMTPFSRSISSILFF